MPTPPSAALATLDRGFALMVRRGLSLPQKQLEPAYFYDALGSAIFDAITRLPEYTITRAELALLEEHGRAIFCSAGEPRELIELGPGNGEKLSAFAQFAPCANIHLIDISAAALQTASNEIERSCEVRASTYCGDFIDGLNVLAQRGSHRLVLFLGSNIGNYTRPEAVRFLRDVHARLSAGDMFLLGADLVKPEQQLLAAYDDPLGVTAAFNKNILVRMNRELGANIDLLAFDHRAVWNAAAGRIEMHLASLYEQTVTLPGIDLSVPFAAGETIWTESCHKYDAAELRRLVESAGFRQHGAWVHPEHGFAELLFAA